MRHVLIVLMFAFFISSTAASQSGGVVYLHDPNDTLAWSPLLCATEICQKVQHLVLPRLFSDRINEINDVSLSTGQDTSLVSHITYSENGNTITATLRDDLLWEDGTPVTAYDAFYTFLAFRSQNGFGSANAFLPLDANTLLIQRTVPTCALYTVQMTLLPAHALQADFVAEAEAFGFTADQDASEQLNAWLVAHPWNGQAVNQHPYHITMPITLLNRDMVQVSPGDFLRVQLGIGDNSVGLHIYNNLPSASSVDYFLAGQLDILSDAPFNRWPDLAQASGVNLYRRPSGEKAVLVFNLTNPNRPAPYKDRFDNLLEQHPHVILSDPAVRQAIASAIDVNQLIGVGLNGFGIPSQEIFDNQTDLTTPDASRFDPALSEQLLTEAGWVRSATGDDQGRQCQGCKTAANGTRLSLTITSDGSYETQAIMAVLERQLERVGFIVSISQDDVENILRSQSYDIAFVRRQTSDVTLARSFITENDGAENVSSYSNTEVDALLKNINNATASHGCDTTQIRDLYTQAEELIATDLPQMNLFAYEEIFAVRDWVLNTDYDALLDPFLGAAQWQVFYGAQDE